MADCDNQIFYTNPDLNDLMIMSTSLKTVVIIKRVCLQFSVDISQSFGLLGVVLIWFLILMPIGVSLCADSVLVFELCLIISFLSA